MKRINHLLLIFFVIFALGCSTKPTENEFRSLMKASVAFDVIQSKGHSDLIESTFSDSGRVSSDITHEIRTIVDGAIIKSDLGKDIRDNLQQSLLVYGVWLNGLKPYINELNQIVREMKSGNTSNRHKIDAIFKEITANEAVRKAEAKLGELREYRNSMLSEMRKKLEK